MVVFAESVEMFGQRAMGRVEKFAFEEARDLRKLIAVEYGLAF